MPHVSVVTRASKNQSQSHLNPSLNRNARECQGADGVEEVEMADRVEEVEMADGVEEVGMADGGGVEALVTVLRGLDALSMEISGDD